MELLVVVAIIGILAAFLMPGLRKSLLLARQVNCMNNLRQIGTAHLAYASDYAGWLWHVGFTSASYDVWPTALMGGSNYKHAEYLKKGNIFCCPASTVPVYATPFTTYGMYRSTSDIEYAAKKYSFNNTDLNSSNTFYQTRRMPPASRFVLTADTICEDSTINPGVYKNKPFYVFSPSKFYENAAVQLRHAGLANAWFMDGHVKASGAFALRETATEIKCTYTEALEQIVCP